MKNLSGNGNYSNLIKNGKKTEVQTETMETIELDPKAVKEMIADYNALLAKCEKLYEIKPDNRIGDFCASLFSLKTIINKF